MTKLNWRDASKELPKENYSSNDLLLNIENEYLVSGNYNYKGFFRWADDYGMYEDFYIHGEVVGWLPIDEIPLPED